MLNINKLQKLMSVKKTTQGELADKIGVSRTALNQAIKRSDFKTSWLEKIAEVLEVPVSYFFDEGESPTTKFTAGNSNCKDLENEIKYLKKEIELKDEIISLLKKK